ncbi:TetR/AcrR family transcriptional regulator [Ancylomarina sp. YFZ004]
MEDSRSKILNASAELFVKNGYDGTSVRQIAKEAGVNIAMISYYFKSKEGVLVDLISDTSKQLKEKTDHIQSLDLKPRERVSELFRTYVDHFVDHDLVSYVFGTELSLNRNKNIVDLILSIISKSHNYIYQCIKACKPDIDDSICKIMPVMILGMVNKALSTPRAMDVALGDESFSSKNKNEIRKVLHLFVQDYITLQLGKE